MAFKVGSRQCLSKCLPLKNLQLDWHFCADLNSQGPQRKSDFFPANTRNVLQGVLAVISLLKRLFKGYLNWGKITDTSYKSVQSLWKVKRKQRASFTCCSIVHRCGKYDQMLLSFCPWESSGLYRRNIPSQSTMAIIYGGGLCTKNYSTKGRGWGLWHVNRC